MKSKEPPYKIQLPLSSESRDYLQRKDRATIYMVVPLAQTYLKVLDQIRSTWMTEKPKEPSALIPFVITCAAALECLLNDYIILHSDYVYGLSAHNRYAKAFMSMTLRAKLDTIVPLLTGNNYTIKTDSHTYQHLVSLIKVRNNLMHGKSFATKNDVSMQHNKSGSFQFGTFSVPKLPHDDLKIGDCDNFFLALNKLDGLLLSHEKWNNEDEPPHDFQDLLARLLRTDESWVKT